MGNNGIVGYMDGRISGITCKDKERKDADLPLCIRRSCGNDNN